MIAALGARAGARPGHVVRVERAARGLSGTPRLCRIQSDPLTGVSGDCYGPAPQNGDTIAVLDETHVLGNVRVTNVVHASDSGCGDAEWLVGGSVQSGEPTWDSAIGVIDVPIDPQLGRLERPRFGTGDWVIGVDRDGDGQRVVEFAHFACDDTGAPSAAPTSTCIEVSASRPRGGLERLRVDRSRNCF
jgi:hypothetical protein